MSGWWVYILRCGARRGPLELVYSEACGTRGDALRREAAIKRLPRAKKLRLIEKNEVL